MRVHQGAGDVPEKQAMLLSLLPFLTEKSTLVLKTIDEACSYVFENAPEGLVCFKPNLCYNRQDID